MSQNLIPRKWYNIQADLPKRPAPPLNPATGKPIKPEELAVIFPETLIEQEMSTQRWIDIPEEVLNLYALWRPTPLRRARRLEQFLETPAKIFYKYEGTSPAGSHKLNTSLAQAFYNRQAGIKRLTTETGAGQWGTALSIACRFFGLDCTVYMVKISYQQKPYRRSFMQVYGAEVIPSPSNRTEAGRKILAQDPDCLGSLGIAISEAVEDAATHRDTNYSLGSVLNHVLLHQTIIGLEAKEQFKQEGLYPDVVIGCHGGGSNFAGLSFPFLMDVFAGKKVKVIAVEPAACPTLTKGKLAYDYGDTVGLTPLLEMYTLGHSFVPPGIHAGGLRYHGAAPLVSRLYADGLIKAQAYHQNEVFAAAVLFAQQEGILPAPESAHAVKAAIDEAMKCKETGETKTILFGLSGHGHFDLSAYEDYFAGKLQDVEYTQEMLEQGLACLPKV
ncbi:tryptophan synthase, beta chain [Thermanaeromonas toyohensis ToBE]|uniref:Tryptophan synthase beta chain n=1 Tax=Thermanaeromonas toyohensis ToBE TaxID=698762 RepID=A0A1W1V9R0_9FIRM|nr:TrpB-like pyridoxal phosphate-dependent enzyme [Thermanaeromonas toyohensis]SMB90013.1 tryptophan synthase, beta chain [Thermanaeromonas toyohensis ToBE]